MHRAEKQTLSETTRAFAGGDLDAVQPAVQHFALLDEAASFLQGTNTADGASRAVGFFGARLDSPEHTVFLTVSKRVSSALQLGRATVGRGTSGATVYLVPPASATAPDGSAVDAAVLIYRYRVPESPQDPSLPMRWLQLHPPASVSASSPPPPPMPPLPALWQEVLESEALGLDRFMRRGALPDVSEHKGAKWTPQVAMQMKCMDGEDAGTEVVYSTTSMGGQKAFKNLLAIITGQIQSGNPAVVPIIVMEKDSYKHKKYGKIFTPELNVVDWMELTATQPAAGEPEVPEEAPVVEEEPEAPVRRRRKRA